VRFGVTAALRERNLVLITAATTISALGSNMAAVALAFAVLRIGGASDLGFVLLAREIPMVVFLLAGGVWADRVSRKYVLVGGYVLMGACQSATASLFLTHAATVWAVALLQIGFGAANAFTRPANIGLVPQAVSGEHLQSANAFVDLSRSTMRIAGPALGGVIVAATNPGWALAADAASFLVGAALLVRLQLRAGAARVRTHLVHELREGWSEFTARTWVWLMVASYGVFQLSLFPAMLVLGPVVAKQHLGGAAAWGTILSFQAVGSVVGGLVALRLRPARPLLTSSLLVVPTAAFLALLGAVPSLWLLVAVGLVASLGVTCSDIFWQTTFQQRIPEHLLSRLSSFDWFGSVVFNPIGYALIAPLAGVIGIPAALEASAAVNGAVPVILCLVPSIRDMRADTADPAPVAA
jgi:MFS family permease